MKKKSEDSRNSRLQRAIAICNSSNEDKAANNKVLKALCEADPVINNVLRWLYKVPKEAC